MLVRRELMREINADDRLIGIKGSRGVGKTTFLLQYAREHFGSRDRSCLYINLNNLYFTDHTLEDFATRFYEQGGRTLLIDQIFMITICIILMLRKEQSCQIYLWWRLAEVMIERIAVLKQHRKDT